MLTTAARVSLTDDRMGVETTWTCAGSSLHRVQFLPRVLDLRDRLELDIGELAVQHLGAADVDILDDVAGLGVDHDRSARAVRVLPALEEGHRLVAGELAVGRLH